MQRKATNKQTKQTEHGMFSRVTRPFAITMNKGLEGIFYVEGAEKSSKAHDLSRILDHNF